MSQELADMDDSILLGRNTYNRGCIAALLGENERAVDLLREAHGQGQGFDEEWHRNIDLESLRGYKAFDEFMRPKG